MGADSLEQLLLRIRTDDVLFDGAEDKTKLGVILPVFRRLGWDVEDISQVVPEYAVQGGKVDFCLNLGGECKVFLEVKRCREELDGHEEQLLGCAFRHGVPLAVLTNGLVWWFYLPLQSGQWKERKFFTLDLHQQEVASLADHLVDFLGRDNIESGRSVALANQVQDSRVKERVTEETLPKAWSQLCGEPDGLLVDLLAEEVASLCGHKPSEDQIAQFLERVQNPCYATSGSSDPATGATSMPTPSPEPSPQASIGNSASRTIHEFPPDDPPDLTYTKVQRFIFGHDSVRETKWKPVVVHAIRFALDQCKSREDIEKGMSRPLRPAAEDGKKGWQRIDGTNWCYQGKDANNSWRCLLGLARMLKVAVEVDVFWGESSKSAYRGQTGRLRWSP